MQPNMRQESAALPPPILTYSLTTQPLPVQVSLSTTSPSLATLIFVVSCPRTTGTSTDPGTATVAGIEIILPVDSGGTTDPTNLCMTAPPASSASISSSDGTAWVASALSPGLFLFTPQDDTVVLQGQSLTIELSEIKINTLVGTALITIDEWAVPGKGTPPSPDDDPPSGQMSMAVAKFPYGFYAGNFTSDMPMVKNGQSPVLSWTGSSNATYLMLYESNSVDVSNVQSWSPPGLTQMTTFILQVSAQQGGQTATMDFSLTIEVSNPSLTAQDLTVLTTSTLKGAVNVGASGAPANLVVNGNVQSQGTMTTAGTLTAQSDASVSGKLSVQSGTTLQNGLTVSGATTLNSDMTANANASVGGQLTAHNTWIQGPVSVFGVPKQYSAGTYSASTDGIVFGIIWPPSQYAGPYYFNATITGNSGGIVVYATGGGWISCANPPNYYGAPMCGTFMLPVRKGEMWTVGLITPWSSKSPVPPPPPTSQYAFYFIALGTTLSATAATLEESSLLDLIPTPPPGEVMMLDMSTHRVLMPVTKKKTKSKKLTAKKKPAARKKLATTKKSAAKKKGKR